jgi:asparagine synthase (glutamine-hydrolysing)
LTGDGGDEVFGGYNKYYMGKMNSAYTKVIPNNLHKYIQKKANNLIKDSEDSRGKKFKVRRLLDSVNYKGEYYWEIISLGFTSNHLVNFLNERSFQTEAFEYFKSKTGISYPSSLTDYRIIDKNISLEGDMLVKVDRTSMMNSLECRAPFLNKEIWDFTMKLPHQYLLKGWDKKRILKNAFENQFPKGFLDKSKQGFGAPVGDWLRTSFNGELRGYSNIDKITKQGIFNPEAVDVLVNNHISGKEDNSFKVWAFYCFQKWYDNTYEKI